MQGGDMQHHRGSRRGRTLAGWLLLAAMAAPACALEVRQGPPESAHEGRDFQGYRAFGSDQGLLQSTVYALAQDRAGYLWAGTEDGVARYGGRHWQPMRIPDAGHAPAFISALAATDDGAVWVAGDESGLLRFDGTALQPIASAPGLRQHVAQGLAVAGVDAVWVGTNGGVMRCDPRGCTELEAARGLNAWTLAPGRWGDREVLWIGTLSAGVRRIDDPAREPRLADFHLGRKDGLPADTVRALAQWGGADGADLWIGTGFGFSRLAGASLVVYGEPLAVTNAAVTSLMPGTDAQGRPALLVGLQRGGLLEVRDDGSWRRLSGRSGLPDEGIYSLLLTDRDRPQPRLWLGTRSSGVLRREDGRWVTIDTRHGLPHRVVFGVGETRFPDGVEGPWIGTADGTVRLRDGAWERLPVLGDEIVYDVARARDGSLWLGSDVGLVHWTRAGVEVYDHHRTGMPGNTVIAVHPRVDAAGVEEIWIGSRHGLARVREGRIEPPPRWPSALGPTVRVFAETRDADGRATLWAGGEGGLEGWDGEGWRGLPPGCLPHAEVMDVRADSADGGRSLWVATRGGLARVHVAADTRCESLLPPALPSATAYQVRLDARGRVYLFGYAGVTRLTPDPAAPTALARMRVERFGRDDGLPSLEFNRATAVDARGRIWAGTIAGAVVYDPAREPLPQGPRPLLLERAERLGGGALAPGELLPPDSGVRFEYALMSYEREHLTRYRTQLVGLDEAVGEWLPAASAEYSRLPPGAYRFRVWGRDALGRVSEPREFGFGIAQPWWQRWWALAGFALALVLAGLGIGAWRDRALKRRAVQLAREVADRTQDLAAVNRRLEAASLTDPLTGLHNRRYFGTTLADEMEAVARRAGRGPAEPRLLLALLDLDYFKSINDRYGHAAGDAVLARAAGALREAAGNGTALRWGGEEFLVVLELEPGVDPATRAQHLVDAVRATEHPVGGRALSVSASVGWAVWPWNPRHPRQAGLDQLLTLADQALYRAKAAGRNRAVGAEHDDAAPPLPEHPELRVRWRVA